MSLEWGSVLYKVLKISFQRKEVASIAYLTSRKVRKTFTKTNKGGKHEGNKAFSIDIDRVSNSY